MTDYFIKEGYHTNLESPDRLRKYTSVPPDQYQEDVYKYAAYLVKQHNLKSVVDCGCGSGYKLVKFIEPVCSDITGLDQDFTIRNCTKRYPQLTWVAEDFSCGRVSIDRKFDLVLSIDVIEHLPNPDSLLEILKLLSHPASHIVISTPERDLVHGVENQGPPSNPYHIREWNMRELRSYLESSGFVVLQQILVDATTHLDWKKRLIRLILPKIFRNCQTAHCRISRF
mgnify:CR=1 FL=1